MSYYMIKVDILIDIRYFILFYFALLE